MVPEGTGLDEKKTKQNGTMFFAVVTLFFWRKDFLPSRLNSQYYQQFEDKKMQELFESIIISQHQKSYFLLDDCPAIWPILSPTFLIKNFQNSG